MEQDPYEEFLATKSMRAKATGFDPGLLTRKAQCQLFEWQQHIVRIAINAGKFALFEDCGLGKSPQQLIWSDEVAKHTGQPVLILCPLAVAAQTVSEGEKFGVKVTHIREAEELGRSGVFITNYDRLEKFSEELRRLSGVVLDESSIIKNAEGKTRRMITEAFSVTPFRLCCTATPAPNDYAELGQHAEFLGVMTAGQMLATWFINDTSETNNGWRLKKHARADFWRWVGSWAACISKPSDIGFSDEGYILPPLELHNHSIAVDEVAGRQDGELFRSASVSAATLQKEARFSITERCAMAVGIAVNEDSPCIIWCELNDESEMLKKLLPEAVEIKGSDNERKKERAAMWFCGMPMTYDELHSIGKSDKLAACGNQNTQPIERGNTTTQNQSGSGDDPRAGVRQKTLNTCVDIISQINPNSNDQESNRTRLISAGESNTQPRKKSGRRHANNLQNGSDQIQEKENSSDSESSDLQSRNLNQSLFGKEEGAPSADSPINQGHSSSPLLITPMQQEESEESYVPRATSDSENSGTQQKCFAEPSNTFRCLISKPEIFGFGMNMQVCTRQVFVGQSWSMERQYQAIRRSYRFGQDKPVHIHFVTPSTLGDVRVRVREKFAAHETMKLEMKEAAKQLTGNKDQSIDTKEIPELSSERWNIYNGDCVTVARKFIESQSVGCTIFSPPFMDLFTYSDRSEDMGNCSTPAAFMEHFKYLVDEITRVTMPGRECVVHCGDLLSSKWKDGIIGLKNFSDLIERAYCGDPLDVIQSVSNALMSTSSAMFLPGDWTLHTRVTIWKDPVIEMQRTKAHGLLYKTLKKDSSQSRVGMPDYLLVFRRRGDNPKPVAHTEHDFELDAWQKIASPVWMDIEQGNVLNRKGSKEAADERHICPLQLDVIERAIKLWSAPGDLIYSPFTGIGSEGYQAVKMQRRFVGSELKASYFKDAALWLKQAESERELFPMQLGIDVPPVTPPPEVKPRKKKAEKQEPTEEIQPASLF